MSEPWEEFWTAEVDSLALEMFERSHEPSFTDDARGMGEAREWAQRVVDQVKAAARCEGQAEALRQAAYEFAEGAWRDQWSADEVECDVTAVRSTYRWFVAKADQIENGDRHADQ